MKTRVSVAVAMLFASPALAADGGAIFGSNCAACHQAHGEGIAGAFPKLAGNAFVAGDEAALAATVLHGRNAMPGFKDSLSDADVAAVLSFVRSNWGNKAAPVTPATVAAARPKP